MSLGQAGGSSIVPFPGRIPNQVGFERQELSRILDLYGRMVAAGEWRDYAMDFTRDYASFAAFKRTAERPQARIEKLESTVEELRIQQDRLERVEKSREPIAALDQLLRLGPVEHARDRALAGSAEHDRAGARARGLVEQAQELGRRLEIGEALRQVERAGLRGELGHGGEDGGADVGQFADDHRSS